MILTEVEALILRNQLVSMRLQMNFLIGLIDKRNTDDRHALRQRIFKTAKALGIPAEEAFTCSFDEKS